MNTSSICGQNSVSGLIVKYKMYMYLFGFSFHFLSGHLSVASTTKRSFADNILKSVHISNAFLMLGRLIP